MSKLPPQRGGARPGAGRPPIHSEPQVRMYVPQSAAPSIVTAIAHYRVQKEIAKLHLEHVSPYPTESVIPAFEMRVPAGFPSPADDYLEEGIDLHKLLVRNAPATFFYTVEKDSDSMDEVGIRGGSRIMVDRSIDARSGMIVLALILGEGATVKELEIRGSRIRLLPRSSNPIHKPRTLKEGQEVTIIGVVTSVITQFKV